LISLRNKKYKYFLYFAIYFSEGLISLIFFVIMPIYLKDDVLGLGMSDFSISIVLGLIIIPLILKGFIGPFIDQFPIRKLGGKRKPYIIIGIIINIILLPFLILINVKASILTLIFFMGVVVLQSFGIVLMDLSMDALVVDTFDDRAEKYKANLTFQIATYLSFLPGIVVGSFCQSGNFLAGFITGSLFCLIGLIAPLFLKEDSEYSKVPTFNLKEFSSFFKTKSILMILIFIFFIQFDTGLLDFTLDPFLRTFMSMDINYQMIAFSPGIIFGLLGAFFATKIKNKFGFVNPVIVHSLISSAYYIIVAFSLFQGAALFNSIYIFGGYITSFTSSIAFIYYFSMLMNSCNKKQAGSVMAFFYTIINLGRLTGIIIAGLIPESILGTYYKMFWIFILCGIAMSIRLIALKKVDPSLIEFKIK